MHQIIKNELESKLSNDYSNISAILVERDGTPLYERYFHGTTAANAVHMFSVTKSIFSALIGIAIEKGYLKSVDQKVLDFFPEHTVDPKNKTIADITLKHLLTMTAPYKYKTEPYVAFFSSENWVNTALDLLGGDGPIGTFLYSPIIGAHILSGILVRVTGQSTLEFATEHLFAPLGISVQNIAFHSKEEQMAWTSNPLKTNQWVVDPQGNNAASFGLSLPPSDMAKIGQLYLNHGVWDGKQILPAKWINDCTTEHSKWNTLSYGYLWWLIDEKEHSFAALGDGGNALYINPIKQLVIVVAAQFVPNAKDSIELIKGWIEPIIENI
ncbi:6-aminohexanoate-dimer hydrolase [Lachnospiraceae bacterium KM106-2]|nr:6-aminohexanoate-dimer hydrolase [Lachnospiraceae bacterium KM106-2]